MSKIPLKSAFAEKYMSSARRSFNLLIYLSNYLNYSAHIYFVLLFHYFVYFKYRERAQRGNEGHKIKFYVERRYSERRRHSL